MHQVSKVPLLLSRLQAALVVLAALFATALCCIIPPKAAASPPQTSWKPPSYNLTDSGSSTNITSYLNGTQTGQGTYFGVALGACGITNTDTDKIAAVSHLLFDNYPDYNGTNPNQNPVCNKQVTATYNGKSVTVNITDRCTACNMTDLDFSPSAFDELAAQSVGRIFNMSWVWLS